MSSSCESENKPCGKSCSVTTAVVIVCLIFAALVWKTRQYPTPAPLGMDPPDLAPGPLADQFAMYRDLCSLAAAEEREMATLRALAGDVHQAWAGTIHLNPDDSKSPAVASEFVATSITSTGDGSETLPSTERVLSRNPHIAFFNNRRGYTLHETTPARTTASFRGLDYVTRPGAPLVDKGVFVVEANDPRIKKA